MGMIMEKWIEPPDPKPTFWDKIRNFLGLYKRCYRCGYKYKHPVKWYFDFRTGDHNRPGTNETCYWMLFKDGRQTHDYPGE